MAKPQKINPETAAHNIATVFCRQYATKLPALDLDGSDFYKFVKTASTFYANAYDCAFDSIVSENDRTTSD